MTQWWEIGTPDVNALPRIRAVAYYRHSAQDRQENSIPIQQDQVRERFGCHDKRVDVIADVSNMPYDSVVPNEAGQCRGRSRHFV
jgi:hypothetical protein